MRRTVAHVADVRRLTGHLRRLWRAHDTGATYQHYDVSLDGRRFVMARTVAGQNYVTVSSMRWED